MKNNVWNKLKNYFIAGLIAILPLWLSFFILRALFNIISSLARPIFKAIPPLASSPLLLDVLSFFGTIIIVLSLGVLLTNVLGRRIFLLVDRLVRKIPVLSWIYTSIRKLTTIFYPDGNQGARFKRVVMFEYPRKGIFVIGFVTSDVPENINNVAREKMVNIFLPTTPNPTSGFLLLLPKQDVKFLDISTEDAIKLIVSGGVSIPDDF